jgi:hypothetical protein
MAEHASHHTARRRRCVAEERPVHFLHCGKSSIRRRERRGTARGGSDRPEWSLSGRGADRILPAACCAEARARRHEAGARDRAHGPRFIRSRPLPADPSGPRSAGLPRYGS